MLLEVGTNIRAMSSRDIFFGFRLSISLIGLVTFVIIGNQHNHFQDGPTFCPIYLLTGFPCPSCGTTRSIYWILRGEPVLAFRFNPLGFITLVFLAIWVKGGKNSLIGGLERLSKSVKVDNLRIVRYLGVLFLVLIFNYVRIESGFFPN